MNKLLAKLSRLCLWLWRLPLKVRIVAAFLLLLMLGLSWPIAPEPWGSESRVLVDRHGALLRVWLNMGMQFRFPAGASFDSKYRICVQEFEDRHFNWHPGVDPLAIVRATKQNWQAGHVQSGASTLTMQVARLRSPRERTWVAKLSEVWMSFRMEWQWSKAEIFAQYASLAPMGGNIVGVDAACWRFFAHAPDHLTWAEAALLAVLPNQPSALNLEKSRSGLMQKRNRLLAHLCAMGVLDRISLGQAQVEPLPTHGEFHFQAPHYAAQLAKDAPLGVVKGTLDLSTQDLTERRANEQLQRLAPLGVRNIAVLVLDTRTSHVLAYVGSQDWNDTLGAGRNDGVYSDRSTGSLLKPFLYGLALQRGPWTPQTLLEDVPTWYGAFAPLNADQLYSGLVPFNEALTRSLNVPAVRMLSEYGVNDFYWWLKSAGLGHLFRTPETYGLPLIIGGAEASLLELVPLYAMLLNNGHLKSPILWQGAVQDSSEVLHPGAAWLTAEMLTEVKRPDIDEYFQWLDNQVPVAWKTGTSFGARDAWAIGGNAQFTVGVWVGNFKGGSIEGLTGSSSAAPLMLNLINDLTLRKERTWPDPPNSRLRAADICAFSGDMAGDHCPNKIRQLLPDGARGMRACPIHRLVISDKKNQYAVCSRCWKEGDTLWGTESVIPPQARELMMSLGKSLPPRLLHNPACPALAGELRFHLVYPGEGTRVFLPRGFDGQTQKLVAEASHEDPKASLHWFLDGTPQGVTQGFHRIALNLKMGKHELILQDASGELRRIHFDVARSSEQ